MLNKLIIITVSATIIAGNALLAKTIDLSNQFNKYSQIQSGGTCHIFSATANFEAACFRATGKHINISEAHAAYLHFRKELGKTKSYPLEEVGIDSSNITATGDGGYAFNTLNRLNRGICTTEENFPFDAVFVNYLQAPQKEEQAKLNKAIKFVAEQDKTSEPTGKLENLFRHLYKYPTKGEALEKRQTVAENFYKTRFPKKMQKSMDNFYHQKEPTATETLATGEIKPIHLPEALNECVTKHKFDIKKHLYTPETIMSLLDKGFPVICEGYYRWADGGQGLHSSNIIGYRSNPKFKGGIEFLIRDSNALFPEWGWSAVAEVNEDLTNISKDPNTFECGTTIVTVEETH